MMIGVVVGVAIGIRRGQTCDRGEVPAVPAVVAASTEQLPLELQQQERTANQAYLLFQQEVGSGETYSSGSIGAAQRALEQLLDEYNRYGSPDQDSPSVAMAKAMIHARLARIFLAQGDPEEYERHLAIAQELSGEPSEDSLFRKVDLLDQVQQE